MVNILKNSNSTDSELTARAVAGQRDAFAQIVMRYQSLVCSLAYSATGSLSQSEDLAQETFIAAWKGLQTLREPEKLRSWLCGITRNIIAGAVRGRKQEPAYYSEPLDEAADIPSAESLPVDHAISNEEESILWRSLEHIPQIYREPIILFYREGQSIESVAEALELSEEVVKQRLSRGRKLLKMEVESFVETALRQSAPGKKFTSAVIAGLPMLTLPAGTSAIGVAASKGSAAAKSGSLLGFIAGMLTPILAALAGFFSMIGTVKSARSPRERKLWIITEAVFLLVVISGLGAYHWSGKDDRFFFAQFVGGLLVLITGIILAKRLRRKIQVEQGQVQEKAASKLPFGNPESEGFKWNMYAWLFGTTFGNPFAYLSVYASKAHDSIVASSIFAVVVATFFLSRRICLRKQEKAMQLWYAIMLIQFPLILTILYLRWERWTGQSPWQMKGSDLTLPVVGFFLFAVAIVVWIIKRNRRITD
jgi:RNA polymerase sigma factor (sigma-70 family)